MKLEELPEFNKGAIAEVGYIQPDCLGRFVGEPEFRLFYLGEVISLEVITDFSGGPARYKRVDKQPDGKNVYAALKVFQKKYQGQNGESKFLDILDGVNINIESIVSFQLMEHKS